MRLPERLLDFFRREVQAEESAGFHRLQRIPDSHVQLRYCVALPEFPDVHPLLQFRFERALGYGHGDWDFVVEENVADVFAAFVEVINYCRELPDRIRAAV